MSPLPRPARASAEPVESLALRSGELARLAGVSSDTLRHYERKGVLPAPRRLANGYRCYPPAALEQVRTVRAALALGFTLDELGRLLRARARGRPPCREVRELAAAKLDAAEARLAELGRLVASLRDVLADWDRRLARLPPGQPARLLEGLAVDQGDVARRPPPARIPPTPPRRKR